MIWLVLPLVAVFAVLAYLAGRRQAQRRAAALSRADKAHSRAQQHGYYAMIWVAVPALVVTILMGVFSSPVAHHLLSAGAPAEARALEPIRF